MKITITIEDANHVPWYAPFMSIDEWLKFQQQKDAYEKRQLEKQYREDWLSSLRFLDTGRDE